MPHDAALVDMKLDKSEQKRLAEPTVAAEAPEYPYGLEIQLQEDSIEKLGIKNLPKPGDKFRLYSEVVTVDVGSNANVSGKKRAHLTLQITAMVLAPAKDDKSASDALYGGEQKES